MTPLWSIRPCVVCGASVRCEPDYPADVRVVCGPCIRDGVENEVMARVMVRATALHAARLAAGMSDCAGDIGALADQFETQGLDSLARHGWDVRTHPEADE
jgi:hypothetical protein